ncbi:hypothetical protein [Streptomyces sp. R35]|uniref:Uncharacterized protein n=1 Tax=Streptomyces sp. R35 TaxID=3238630 RepID=A0AB39SJC9_9ACTN
MPDWVQPDTEAYGVVMARQTETDSTVLQRGTLMYDPATRKVGEYRDMAGPYAMLRPVGGGREWQADPDQIRPATAAQRLSAGVEAANARAGQGL